MSTTSDEDISVLVFNLDKTDKCLKSYKERENEIVPFLERCASEVDVCLFSEACARYQITPEGTWEKIDDQVEAVMNSLKKSGKWKDWSTEESTQSTNYHSFKID